MDLCRVDEFDFGKSMDVLLPATSDGDVEDKLRIGVMIVNSLGVDRDYARAQAIFQESSGSGNAFAVEMLGRMYHCRLVFSKNTRRPHSTKGGPLTAKKTQVWRVWGWHNFTKRVEEYNGILRKCLELYRRAAALEQPEGETRLAEMHKNGLGVEQNFGTAVERFERAHELGDFSASISLGEMYRLGSGVEQDVERAAELFRSGAKALINRGGSDVGASSETVKLAQLY